jgi:hypothetical protein
VGEEPDHQGVAGADPLDAVLGLVGDLAVGVAGEVGGMSISSPRGYDRPLTDAPYESSDTNTEDRFRLSELMHPAAMPRPGGAAWSWDPAVCTPRQVRQAG